MNASKQKKFFDEKKQMALKLIELMEQFMIEPFLINKT